MIPWIHAIAFFPLAILGILAGRRFARSPRWWVAILPPMAIVLLVILGHRSFYLSFIPPISWAVDATLSPFLMTIVVGVLLSTLLWRLPQRRTQRAVAVGMAVILIYYGFLPGIMPLVVRGSLLATQTQIDRHGTCIQTHGYTCGPASAVTCLRRLGLVADEGTLAIESRCAPALGTDPRVLADAISDRYRALGVTCDYRWFPTLDELPVPAIADMYMPHIGGHYVAVMEVRRDAVIVADPLSGTGAMPREEFLASWNHAAHVFTVRPPIQ